MVPPTVTTLITSMLALIGQQRVITKKLVSGDRPTNSRQTSEHRPDITMLDILRPREVSGAARTHREKAELAYRRWFMRGHWRHQPYES